MERPYCDWKTKLETNISYAVTDLVIVVYTLRGVLLCNRLSENSPVFEKPQRIRVRSSLACVSEIFISDRRGTVTILSGNIGFLDGQ